ncbi:L-lactate dehydrogenase [Clostridium minihomine]|uniref:L-lactate dehydrogenase n=1 Tax=Clostridium minihomine TaxID=2045012 RepID=UPI000C791175|nr:L-lactate dehydrogenase [Clostridium minihomine]
MKNDNRKIVLVGTGFVGMSFAYALLNQTACDELVLIDVDTQKAEGEAMDLNHGVAFSASHMKIYAGGYSDCKDADIVAICAGVAQKPGETRIDLLQRNTAVFHSIIAPVVESGFRGIFLIATNPVDIMAHVTQRLSGFPASRVIGTGTTLDSARLRYMLGSYLEVDPRNVHAYVMGEHGDSEFVPWSQAMVGTKPVLTIVEESPQSYSVKDLEEISEDVKNAAQKIIAAKKSTYYGIGMSMVRIVKAVFGDEKSILTVSTLLQGEYGQADVYIGVPCIVSRDGVCGVLEVLLTKKELEKFKLSANLLQDAFGGIRFEQ